MLEIFFIAILSIMPFFLSRFLLRQAIQQWEETLGQVRADNVLHLRVHTMFANPSEQCAREEDSYFIGNTLCRYNARSPYLRCAVNPAGPCQNCRHFRY
ncbi:MAG: hypothetical protein J7647_05340 [Cyanobacteria bacterium SBLK]|nr:hypothetical protein [Cyanobacteria bacterium SBLK]